MGTDIASTSVVIDDCGSILLDWGVEEGSFGVCGATGGSAGSFGVCGATGDSAGSVGQGVVLFCQVGVISPPLQLLSPSVQSKLPPSLFPPGYPPYKNRPLINSKWSYLIDLLSSFQFDKQFSDGCLLILFIFIQILLLVILTIGPAGDYLLSIALIVKVFSPCFRNTSDQYLCLVSVPKIVIIPLKQAINILSAAKFNIAFCYSGDHHLYSKILESSIDSAKCLLSSSANNVH